MTDLSTVQSAIINDDKGKWDRDVSLSDLQMDSRGRLYRKNGRGHLALTDHALRQLCQRVIPNKGGAYVSKVPLLHLRQANLNYCLKDKRNKHKGALVRGKGRYIRAILSDDFTAYDNKHLIIALTSVLSGLESRGTLHVIRRHFLDDRSLWIDVTFPRLSRPDLGGLEGGIRIGNSEVGVRSVTCFALVWRMVCSNGLMSWGKGQQLFKKVHRGRFKPEQVSESLSVAISESLESADDLLDRLAASASEAVSDIEAVIERIVKRRSLSQEFAAAMVGVMVSEPAHYGSLFGLVNAMTQAAKIYFGDRRVQIEGEAARLLNWREDTVYSEIVKGYRKEPMRNQ